MFNKLHSERLQLKNWKISFSFHISREKVHFWREKPSIHQKVNICLKSYCSIWDSFYMYLISLPTLLNNNWRQFCIHIQLAYIKYTYANLNLFSNRSQSISTFQERSLPVQISSYSFQVHFWREKPAIHFCWQCPSLSAKIAWINSERNLTGSKKLCET